MKILYIDTSSSFLYSAIYDNNTIISEVKEEYGQSLSEVALPKIVEMFTNNNLSPKAVDKIIVVNYGKIAEAGSHEELLKNPDSIYAALYHAQMK